MCTNTYTHASLCVCLCIACPPTHTLTIIHSLTHARYALLLSVGRGEHDAAEELYLHALSLNPFHKRTLSDYGFFLERIRGMCRAVHICMIQYT